MPATRLDVTVSHGNNHNLKAIVYLDEEKTQRKDLTGIDSAVFKAWPMTGPFEPFEFDLAGNGNGQVVVVDALNGEIEAQISANKLLTEPKKITNWAHSLLVVDGNDHQDQYEGFITVTFGPAVSS